MSARLENIVGLVPAFNPDQSLLKLVRDIAPGNFKKIIIVDDGSESKEIFNDLKSFENVEIIEHPENLGKGAALKTGFAWILKQFEKKPTHVITFDADGQHLPEDIKRLAKTASGNSESFLLGSRSFSGRVPLRSLIGNVISAKVFSLFTAKRITDCQSGLRAYPSQALPELLEQKEDGYDFELRSLFSVIRNGWDIQEIPISTIYLNENSSSHFRPFIDSLMIYFVFFRFVAVSFLSFVLDISLFILAYRFSGDIQNSTFISRSVSACFNFSMNKYTVFRSISFRTLLLEAVKYACLAFIIASASAYSVALASSIIPAPVVLIKVVVDTCLFIFSFIAQKAFIFVSKVR